MLGQCTPPVEGNLGGRAVVRFGRDMACEFGIQSFIVRVMNEMDEIQGDRVEGRWSKDEHERFLVALMQFGKDWKKVEQRIQSRNGPQVRSHSQKYFLKLNKINKERRKHKNREHLHKSETQEEILKLFTETDVTQHTPLEMVAILRNQIIPYRNHAEKTKSQDIKKVEIKNTYEPINEQNNEKDSYLMKIMKRNKQYFLGGNEFLGLVDFGNHLEDDTTPPRRKQSWTLVEEDRADTRGYDTLRNLK